jgi:hypothetical protein
MLTTTVFAGETDIGGGPEQEYPQVYLLKKVFDICDQNGAYKSGSDPLPGGSVPPSGQQYGCVDYIGDRFNEYLFTGEQMAVLVAVRHTQGAIAIMRADLALDGTKIVKCNDISDRVVFKPVGNMWCTEEMDLNGDGFCADYVYDTGEVNEYTWFGHDIQTDLNEQPPAKTAGTPTGFDPRFDKLYECILTATDDMEGEYDLTVIAMGEDDTQCGESVPDQIWFNPEIFVDVFTSDMGPIAFGDGAAGSTVYSTNTLKIKNGDTVGAGVDIAVWLAGTDLTSSILPAKCPESNVLEADNIEFRCKIGSIFNNPWHYVPNPNDKEDCEPVETQEKGKPLCFDAKTVECTRWDGATDYYHGPGTCQGALDIVPDSDVENILYAGHTAECWFRLTYPVPCIGLFDTGQILIFARAI